jgi:hypothetical protein
MKSVAVGLNGDLMQWIREVDASDEARLVIDRVLGFRLRKAIGSEQPKKSPLQPTLGQSFWVSLRKE